MPFPPYLANERLEDFRADARSEGFYADAQEQRLRDIRAIIDACCEGRLSITGALSALADHDAIEPIALNRDGRKGVPRSEKIAWAREAIREAFTETILSLEDARGIGDLG